MGPTLVKYCIKRGCPDTVKACSQTMFSQEYNRIKVHVFINFKQFLKRWNCINKTHLSILTFMIVESFSDSTKILSYSFSPGLFGLNLSVTDTASVKESQVFALAVCIKSRFQPQFLLKTRAETCIHEAHLSVLHSHLTLILIDLDVKKPPKSSPSSASPSCWVCVCVWAVA